MNKTHLFKNFILQWQTSTKVALICDGEKVSYQTLIFESIRLANHFQSERLKRRDRIAINLPNSLEFIYCFFACMLGGYVIIPINASLPQSNIRYIIELTKPKLFINSLEQFKQKNSSANDHELNLELDSDDIFSIFFTSGTTSLPKGVCHTLESLIENSLAFNNLVGINEKTVMMHVMPMGYMAGFLNTVLSPIVAGGTVVIAPQFSAHQAINFWEYAIDYEVNTIWLNPTMATLLSGLNRDKNIALWTESNLINVFIGTAPLSQNVKENFEKTFKVKCLESYGMTEILIAASNASDKNQKKYSVGLVLDYIDVKTQDKNGNLLPPGQAGEIYIKSPFLLKGYLDETHDGVYCPLKNGWFPTGDYGYLDNDNYLFIEGRIKDLIIRGGINISPKAVEEVILSHPHVKDASVIGKFHPFWGEEVISFIVVKDKQNFDVNLIKEYCQKSMSPEAVPVVFNILDELPRSSTGKVSKKLLKEML